MDTRVGAFGLVGSLVLALGACGPVDEDYDDIGLEFRSSVADVPLSSDGGRDSEAERDRPGGGGDDGWAVNGLDDPDVSHVDPAYGLNTSAGLAEDAGILGTEPGRGIARYLVECALPEGRSISKTIDGQVHVFEGDIGLAPEWETGACDQDCQEWVSACLLARTNVTGEVVPLWLQSDHPAIGFGWPEGIDVVHEASWYGNLFADGTEQFLCRGETSGSVAIRRSDRTCSSGSSQQCGFTLYSHCDKGRCVMAGDAGDVPIDCKADGVVSPYHTISTFVAQ